MNTKLLKLPVEDVVNITDNVVICKEEIDDMQIHSALVEEKIEQELIEDDIVKYDSVLFNNHIFFSNEENTLGVNIIDNVIVCKDKDEIDDLQTHSSIVKGEIKQEVIEDDIVKYDSVLFNAVFPFCSEESTPVNIFYYCHQCNYGTNDKKTLTDHVFTHRLKCNQCSYTTLNNDSFISHKEIHSDKCGYQTKHKSSLTTHFSENLLKCKVCDLISEHSYSLKENPMKHFGEQHFTCEKCYYKTNIESFFLTHNKKHPEEFSTNEEIYQKANFQKMYIMKHSREHLICEKCGFQTEHKSKLLAHMTTHFSEKSFKCNVCDLISEHSYSLKENVMKHFGEQHVQTNNKYVIYTLSAVPELENSCD